MTSQFGTLREGVWFSLQLTFRVFCGLDDDDEDDDGGGDGEDDDGDDDDDDDYNDDACE